MTQVLYVYGELGPAGLRKTVFQCLQVADRLAGSCGGQVAVLVAGPPGSAAHVGRQLAGVAMSAGGARPALPLRIVASEAPQLATYTNLPYTRALAAAWQHAGPGVLLMGHTAQGRDLAPRLAQRLGLPLVSDVTGFETAQGKTIFTRPIYAGKATAKVRPTTPHYLVTVRTGAFPEIAHASKPHTANNSAAAAPLAVESVAVTFPESDARVSVVNRIPRATQSVDLTEADYVVSGGIGLGGPQGFDVLRPLAQTLGAAIGASRAACNAGWIDHQHQVGQTGKTVSPKLYLACGISGQIQHQAGIRTARCIVAINTDPNAPIFRIADYGIAADLFKVVPVLNEKLTKVLHEA